MTRTAEQDELLKKHAKQMAVEPKKMMAGDARRRPGRLAGPAEGDGRPRRRSPRRPCPTASGMTDAGPEAPPVRLLRKGNSANPGDVVAPGFLSVLGSTELPEVAGRPAATTGRRKALAEWVTRPDHPLTARVMVNRLWQDHFGRGIVATPGDFGTQGASPTHPELLDWLATELVARGWSLKAIHRLMVTSATYRQSSIAAGEGPRGRPRQPPVRPDDPPEARGRGRPRRPAGRLRPARRPGRRPERLPRPAARASRPAAAGPAPPRPPTGTAGASTSSSGGTSSTPCSTPSTSPTPT